MRLLAILILLAVNFEKRYCAVNFIITNWTQCDNTPIKLQVNSKMLNETYQVINADYSSPVINGDNFRLTIDIEYRGPRSWIHFYQLKDENGFCKSMERFGGEAFKAIRSDGGVSTKCPIPKGSYHLRNYRVKYERLKFPSPQGKFRLHFRLHEKSTGKLSMCLDFEVLSKPLY